MTVTRRFLPVVFALAAASAGLPWCAQSPAYDSVLTSKAMIEYAHHRFNECIQLTDAAIKANAKDADAHMYRALALSYMERQETAAREFDIAFPLRPHANFQVYYQAAGCYAAVGEMDKALNSLNKSIALKPTAVAFREQGQVLWTLKRSELAYDAFEKAIKLDPTNSYWPYFDRASCYMQAGRNEDALRDLDKIIKMRPTEARGYAARAKVYMKMGKRDLADADRRNADELSITNF